MSHDDKKKIAEAKFIVGESIQAIADQLDISRRTIERWAKDGDWRNVRESASAHTNVVPINSKPIKPESPKVHRPRISRGLNDLEIIDQAIADLHASLPEAEFHSKGGIAGAIARLVELKRKMQPETVVDLVERAIELGIGPDELLKELKDAWAKRA